MAVSQSGNVGSLTQIRVRGAEADHVKVLLDGHPLHPASANVNLATISPTAVSRIEALNGPRSAVWGHDALAGVINLSTQSNEPRKRIHLATGSNNMRSVGVGLNAKVATLPVEFHIASRATDGINVAHVGAEQDGFQQDALHLGYRRNEGRFQSSGFYRITESDSEYDPIPLDGDQRIDVDDEIFAHRLTWQASNAMQLTANTSFTQSSLSNFSNGDETNSTHGDHSRLALEGQFAPTTAQNVSVVLDHTREDFRQRGTPSFFGDPNYDESVTSTGIGLEYLYQADALQFHGSLRNEQNSDFGDSTAWHGSVLYRQNQWRTSYSVGIGIKNPTFIERFGFTPAQFLGNPDLKPEQALQHEVALSLVGQNQTVDLAVFDSVLADEINGFAFDAVSNQFTAINLSNESRRRGFEFRYSAQSDNLEFSSNYAYVRSKEHQSDEVRRPKHLANLRLQATFSDRMRSTMTVRYVGAQLDRDFSTWPATIVTLDDHVLASTTLAYDLTTNITLHGLIENVLDTTYEQVVGHRTPGRTFSVGAQVAL